MEHGKGECEMVSIRGRLTTALVLALGLVLAETAVAQTPLSTGASNLGSQPPGIAFGPQHLPENLFGPVYTGTVRIVSPRNVLSILEAARGTRTRVILNLSTTPGSQDPDGAFSLERWRARVDRFARIDFEPYIADGTLLGHYLMDEPHSPNNWNGKAVPFSDIEEAARYSKARWPNMTTFVRTHPGFLAGAPFTWAYVDAAWAQYSARRGDVRAYLEENVASARSLGLGLVVGMNVLTGGSSESGIRGYQERTRAMSASQIRTWGSILAAEPYACALSIWKYDKDNPAYLDRPEVQAAMAEVSQIATNRPRASCRVR
jgi:hypothetical protein